MSVMSTGFSRDERRGAGGGGGGVKAGGGHPDCVRSIRETAALLNVSVATLRRMIAARTIRVVKLSPRRIGIRDSAREAFLQENAI
jgi:excisionase family DNA binding protein